MRCKRCGTTITASVELCPTCGASVRRRRPKYVRCRACGQRVRASGKLCPACGTELQRSWRTLVLACLTVVLLAAGYYVLTQVVTIDRIRQQINRLPTVSFESLLPQATPTIFQAPTRATEARPTPTRIPTMTPFLSLAPTATAVPTETPLPSPTRRPPSSSRPALALLAPASGTEFAGAESEITLSWQPVEALGEAEGDTVTLRYKAGGQAQTVAVWTRDASWRAPAEVYGKRDAAAPALEWSVRVTERAADGPALSPPSATWSFTWR